MLVVLLCGERDKEGGRADSGETTKIQRYTRAHCAELYCAGVALASAKNRQRDTGTGKFILTRILV